MNNQIPKEYTSLGTLIVSVYTAGGAIPIEGALVSVRGANQNGSGIISVLYTDQSGNTPRISLPAPPASTSESPGGITPFATYNVEVAKENFYPKSFINVPIFAGTTSIQPANLIPKTEYEGQALVPNEEIVTESQNPDL
ncbi:MAG: hypothetical protein E7598_02815 [Ruminococcaceae bacterium]|nr:hypothetical protein [Oscillospiraceae bacterium]